MRALALLLLLAVLPLSAAACPEFLQQEYRKLHSTEQVSVCHADAKGYLLVNTASHCGFTPQFKGLEQIHQAFKEKGLVVIGFASDDFKQESKDEAKAAEICYVNYGVTFTMLAPTAVRGEAANPTFKALANASTEPGWNFNKYLVSADGKQVTHFGSFIKPEDVEFRTAVEQLLR